VGLFPNFIPRRRLLPTTLTAYMTFSVMKKKSFIKPFFVTEYAAVFVYGKFYKASQIFVSNSGILPSGTSYSVPSMAGSKPYSQI
jgi:hypothetical protein